MTDEIDIVAKATYSMPKHGWTCFHCGETFKTPGAAQNHFGQTPNAKPGCLIKAEPGLLLELRKAETEISQLRGRVAEMEGWKLVPVEPSGEMISAFYQAVGEMEASESRNIDLLLEGAERVYRAMLSAAPSPPSPDRGMK